VTTSGRGHLAAGALSAILLSSAAAAQDAGDTPIVRGRVETETPVMVGEAVTVSVDVLTPTWFPRAPRFPAALQVENAVAVFDETFRTNLSEAIGGERWSGIRRRYLIYPQLAGAYTVPPIEVGVVYALPNARPSDFQEPPYDGSFNFCGRPRKTPYPWIRGLMTAWLEYYLRGLLNYQPENDNFATGFERDSFAILNLYAGVRSPDGRWDVTLWAKNALDDDTVLQLDSEGVVAGFASGYRGVAVQPEREIGLSLRYAFGGG